jgi:penicillin G amidase
VLTAIGLAVLVGAGCRRRETPGPPLVAQVTGTLPVEGLESPVRVVRDHWGVPHIYATSQSDLFVAQGFVQAQDRLFQMDLWRRAALGRLSEVLGPNFIERDAMTRRIQYGGKLDVEWSRYGADAKEIAAAFVRGINAWVARARVQPPEPFVLAGWRPEPWSADDLLNRTDAVVENAGVLEDIARAGLGHVVADSIRRAGAPPFFTGLAAPAQSGAARPFPADRELSASVATVPLGKGYATAVGSILEFADSSVRFEHPSARYLVHLVGAGWNVIGVTSPWRPGVAAGHNGRVAWAFAPSGARTQTVRAIPDTVPVVATVTRTIRVKGREEPFSFDTELTAEGIVIATDRAARRRFVFQWTGFDSGAAPEMLSVVMDRAATLDAFRAAALNWMLPARSFVALDAGAPAALPHGATRQGGKAPDEMRPPRALFAHPLGVTAAARRRFDIGPAQRPFDDQPVRLSLDVRSWEQSRAMNAPGQSENPDGPHFSDLVSLWSAGDLFPLAFSDAAVEAHAETTLTLLPAARNRSP